MVFLHFFATILQGGGCVFGRGKSGQLIPFRLAPLADRKEEPFSFSPPPVLFFCAGKKEGEMAGGMQMWKKKCMAPYAYGDRALSRKGGETAGSTFMMET